jgi:hypothetical protein
MPIYYSTKELRDYCYKGKLSDAKNLWNFYVEKNIYLDLHDHNDELLKITCKNGHFEIVKWIWQLTLDINSGFKYDANIQHAFYFSCVYAHYNIVEWFLNLYTRKQINLNVTKLNNYMWELTWDCRGGSEDTCFETMKLLWKFMTDNQISMDLHINNDELFLNCLLKGHFKIVKWLWQISLDIQSPINLNVKDGAAFIICCGRFGSINMAHWLLNVSNDAKIQISINSHNEAPVRLACANGWLSVSQWLWKMSIEQNHQIDFHINDDEAFRMACRNGHLEVAQWLWKISIDTKSSININVYKIYSTYRKEIDMQKKHWVCSNYIMTRNCADSFCGDDEVNSIYAHKKSAFTLACEHNHKKVIEWLWNLSKEIGCPIDKELIPVYILKKFGFESLLQ